MPQTTLALSNYAENALVNHLLRNTAYTPVATVYLALLRQSAAESGSGLDEPSGNGYARQAIAFSAAANRAVANSGVINFGPASGAGWGTIAHCAIMDASSGGNVLAYGTISSRTVIAGNRYRVGIGGIVLTFNNRISTYAAAKLLDLMFRNQAYTPPATVYALLLLDEASIEGSGLSEPSGNGYARQAVTFSAPSNGATSNNAELTFGPNTTTPWGQIEWVGVADASSNGNLLVAGPGAHQTPAVDDVVTIAATALAVSFS